MEANKEIAKTLRNALTSWNWDDNESALEDMADNAARSGLTVCVVEDWFARKELNGAQILLARKEHETEQAVLYQQANDLTEYTDSMGTHITEAWVPKSVIKAEFEGKL